MSTDIEKERRERIENRELSPEYRVTGRAGGGGCSVVYDGYRISDERHAAIKVLSLPAGLEQSEAEITRKRFYREARVIDSMRSRYIVDCLDYGVFNGEPCVILEYIEGVQLDDYLRACGALPFEYAVGIVCQMLEGLSDAHSKGVIHRDIKPANVMVLDEMDSPEIRILDFGIATLLDGNPDDILKTKIGSIRGTPSYMAPELFSGQVRASVESDIYAIGLVLAECLTGTVCVSGTSLMQIAYKQVHEPLELPGFIPECLASVIRKCCEKEPEDRYHDAKDVETALRAVLPQACDERAECEAAYLKAIKDRGKSIHGKRVNVKKDRSMGLAIAVIIVLLAIIGGGVIWFASNMEAESPELPVTESAPAAGAMPVVQPEPVAAPALAAPVPAAQPPVAVPAGSAPVAVPAGSAPAAGAVPAGSSPVAGADIGVAAPAVGESGAVAAPAENNQENQPGAVVPAADPAQQANNAEAADKVEAPAAAAQPAKDNKSKPKPKPKPKAVETPSAPAAPSAPSRPSDGRSALPF